MLRRLLVPLDGAELAPRAIVASIALTRELGAAIAGFIAESPVPCPSQGARGHRQQASASVRELRTSEHARHWLDRFEKLAQRAGVPFEGHCVHTHDVAASIIWAAHEYACDLTVMVTHGRGALGQWVHGSCTKGVLAHTRLPVLVLH